MSLTLRIGTRGSALARWQADHVAGLLRRARSDVTVEIVVITTSGDRSLETPLPLLGGKGAFTEELETALRDGTLDIAVHSLKDLPTALPDGLILGAIPKRGGVRDVLISRAGHTLDSLPSGAIIGTGSPRRAAQILRVRPDVRIESIRGNVDTRINKALDANGRYDGIILAEAGLERIGRLDVVSEFLPLDVMLPAPGQGALAVQCRADGTLRDLLASINHIETEIAVTAERAFLAAVGTGCALPIAAYGEVEAEQLYLWGRICSADGQQRVEFSSRTDAIDENPDSAGTALAMVVLEQGGAALIGGSEA